MFLPIFLENDVNVKRKKVNLKINLNERNPVAILNELKAGLSYELLEQSGPSHAPIFTVAVNVNGQRYLGAGKSKKLAKCNAANAALRSFIQFPDNCKVIQNKTSNDATIDFTTDVFEPGKNHSETVPKKNALPKGPVMLLNELYPSTKYECKENEGDVFSRFHITVNIGGECFIGTGY